jgi:hypothetical protein
MNPKRYEEQQINQDKQKCASDVDCRKSSNYRTDGPGGLAIDRSDRAPALAAGRITCNASQAPPQRQSDTFMQTIPLGR